MNLIKFETSQFAGLKDLSLNFQDGLNVILGPNEAGKSTIIDGIHATLFKDINLKMNIKDDKEFAYRFMPKPNGDNIDGSLVFQVGSEIYKLKKAWGVDKNISLKTPDGNIIKNNNTINDILKDILVFGQTTYSNIVFAKQRKLKESISNIVNDSSLSKEITDVLRMAMLELDGVSIDDIENNINKELDRLYRRWDIEKNYPENNRGVNNQYKQGLGKIIKAFYLKEELNMKKNKALKTELEYEKVCSDINMFEEELRLLKKEKEELEAIEEDINNRELLDLRLVSLNKDIQELMEINRNWPVIDLRIKEIRKKLKQIDKKKESLNLDMTNLKKLQEKKKMEEILVQVNKIDDSIIKKEELLNNSTSVTQEKVKELKELKDDIFKLSTQLEAGNINVNIKKSISDTTYSKDLKEEVLLKTNEQISSEGFLRINYNNEFICDIKSQNIDYENLIIRKNKKEKEKKEILNSINSASIEDAKFKLDKINDIKSDIKRFKVQKETILNGKDVDFYKNELLKYSDLDDSLKEEKIIKELDNLSNLELELKSELNLVDEKLKSWTTEYTDIDNLFNLVVDKKTEEKEIKSKLKKLKPLPEEFNSTNEFKERLRFLRADLEAKNNKYLELKQDYYEKKNLLLEETYEELNVEHNEAEKKFNYYINRGKKLLKIKDSFLQTKEKMLDNPMDPLVREFNNNMEIITNGKYKSGDIDEDLNIVLTKDNSIPIDLLSAGTTDSVSLALRLSLVKYIFDESGFLLLDDCLVDLDPIRKKRSIELIQDFSERYQVIFTTCNPSTAKMLGGNIINL